MWYWIVAVSLFLVFVTAFSVFMFVEGEGDVDCPPCWVGGVFFSGLFAVAWFIVVPLALSGSLCVGGGYLIYKKWFKKESK